MVQRNNATDEYNSQYGERIVQLYEEGHSAPAISALLDVPAYQVRFILQDHGIQIQGGSRSAKERAWDQIEPLLSTAENAKQIAETLGIPYNTLVRWLREEGVTLGQDRQKLTEQAISMAQEGKTLSQIAETLGVGIRTVSRWLAQNNTGTKPAIQRRSYKKEKHWEYVLEAHRRGETVEQIAKACGVHWGSVASWLRAEGESPNYIGVVAKSSNQEKSDRKDEAIRRYLRGEAATAIDASLHLAHGTTREWAKEAGIESQGGKAIRRIQKSDRAMELYAQGASLDAIQKRVRISYYDLRIVLDEKGLLSYPDEEKPDVYCPCGKKTGSPDRSYCCSEHTSEYKPKRQKDPAKQITFTCLNCGTEKTIPKSYTSQGKYCSNECSQQHRRSIEPLNGLEQAFAGLCTLMKINCRRPFGIEQIPYQSGSYAPDFICEYRGEQIAVEIKGDVWIKEDTLPKHIAWRESGSVRDLALLFQDDVDVLRLSRDADEYWGYLVTQAKHPHHSEAVNTNPEKESAR